VARASVDGVALRFVDQGFAAPLTAEAGKLSLALQAAASAGAGGTELDVTGLDLAVDAIRVQAGTATAPWLQLGRFAVDGAHAKLSGRELGANRVSVSDGALQLVRDAQGRLPVLDGLARAAAASAPAATSATAPSEAPPWRYRIATVEASKLGVTLRDESVSPAAAFALVGIQVSAENVSEDLQARMPLRLALGVQGGGRLEARGHVVPGTPAAELKLSLRGLALSPLQPYLAQFAELAITRGQVESDGTLRYAASTGARFDGSVALRDLLIQENAGKTPFLAWKHLASRRVTASEKALDIGDLELAGLDTQLVIFKDRTINIAKAFHARATPAGAAASAPAAAAVATAAAPPPYRVDIGRVRVVDSEVDFADLSLALPFAARVNALQGQIVGLSTQPGRIAQLEFTGQVDEYGSARAAGRVELADPTHAMDIQVAFRNVEMTSLTPYSATFAGRKIASGKLSLDLDYKLAKRQLQGENRIVMDKLTLGDRVESPTAMDLPLDLALAILKDSDGRIELGLPVSGSLDDPQFSYGGLVWKALLSVITKVITAPFRAIGALFGGSGGSEQAPEVVFDAGTATLQPPQREKLDMLAKALAQRPGLALSVQAAYAPQADGAALKELQLRRQVARTMGREPAAGEDPGPIASSQPEVQKALETLYARSLGEPALQTLRAQHRRANAAAGDSRPPSLAARLAGVFQPPEEPLPADLAARLRGTALHALLAEQLLAREQASEAELASLGTQRATAIRTQLVTKGVAAERVQVLAPAAHESGRAGVVAKLELTVATATMAAAAASDAIR
jgi:hypothetical protein